MRRKCEGFQIFGVEYAHERFCGDELQTGSVKALEREY